MCGYIKRVTDRPAFRALMEQLGWDELIEDLQVPDQPIQHFYPAFGGDTHRQIQGLIIASAGAPRAVDATWWFDCRVQDNQLQAGSRTTFNARNLGSPFWVGALHHHRGIVIADVIGESKYIAGRKHQYLMTSDNPFLLGALYQPFSNDQFSCAIITRDEHPKFHPYHDKAFPLFLPPDRAFLQTWLDPDVHESDDINALLQHPRLFPSLTVQEVKTYKSATPIGKSTRLDAD